MAENKEELSIEEMFDRLDGIMRTLEDSRSTLEESFASYEAGMQRNGWHRQSRKRKRLYILIFRQRKGIRKRSLKR